MLKSNRTAFAGACLSTVMAFSISCARSGHYPTVKTPQRQVGIYSISQTNEQESVAIVSNAFSDLYDARVRILGSDKTLKQELPAAALKEAALQGVDDLVLLFFPLANAAGESNTLGLRLVPLSELKTVLRLEVPLDEGFVKQLKSGLAQGAPNLDAFAKPAPEKIAAHLESNEQLAEALAIYEAILAKQHNVKYLHEINSRDELDRRIRDLRQQVELKRLNQTEAPAFYTLNVEFMNVGRRYQEIFSSVVAKLNLSSFFRRYTQNPTNLKLTFPPNNAAAQLELNLSFHPTWYRDSIAKEPLYHQGKRILYFSPYFNLMYKLQELRQQFMHELEESSASIPGNGMDLKLLLTNGRGDQVTIPIHVTAEGKIRHPQTVRISMHGFSATDISVGDQKIYDRTGLFVIGQPSLLSGQRTQWGLLYDFFGLTLDMPADANDEHE